MRTGDGLLARLRVRERRLNPLQLRQVAALAQRFGNGLVEITARGNLQVRGLSEQSATPFARAVDGAMAIETGLVVETPPLAGLDPSECTDPRPLAAAVRQFAARQPDRLGPKVTVVVDGGALSGLSGLGADLSFLAIAPAIWRLSIGGEILGCVADAEALPSAMLVLRELAMLGPAARARDLDSAAWRHALGAALQPLPETAHREEPSWLVPLRTGAALRVALPFGSISGAVLQQLAEAGQRHGVVEFRLALGHALFALGEQSALLNWKLDAAALGLVTAPDDPRFAVHACMGSVGCASGVGDSRALAADLLQTAPALFDGSWSLHVSGCAKGCARPRASDLTLVAQTGGWGLIWNGRATDAPALQLAAAELPAALARLDALVQDEQQAGERAAAVLQRLGRSAVIAALGPAPR